MAQKQARNMASRSKFSSVGLEPASLRSLRVRGCLPEEVDERSRQLRVWGRSIGPKSQWHRRRVCSGRLGVSLAAAASCVFSRGRKAWIQ
mgnify:CR=1 FL=1